MPLNPPLHPQQSLAFRLFVLFQRIVGVFCLLSGLKYWTLLLGIHGGEFWRFDLMPVYWQAASASLAVLLPVAAVGLWMPNAWGAVVWFVAAASEAVMYYGFPELFGRQPFVLATHAMTVLLYAIFRVVLHREKQRARRPVRVDSL